MNDKQKNQFNVMLRALKAISKDFLTPEQLFKNSQKLYGLDYTEALEMAYENCLDNNFNSEKNCFKTTFLLILQ
jgi:hypothetical protein